MREMWVDPKFFNKKSFGCFESVTAMPAGVEFMPVVVLTKEEWENRDKPLNIIFDGPPSHDAGRFVEVETDDGRSINAGEWIERPDGLWALRITRLPKGERLRLVEIAAREE